MKKLLGILDLLLILWGMCINPFRNPEKFGRVCFTDNASFTEISQHIFFFLFEKQNSQVTVYEWYTHINNCQKNGLHFACEVIL